MESHSESIGVLLGLVYWFGDTGLGERIRV
jgi:hypothetical protein